VFLILHGLDFHLIRKSVKGGESEKSRYLRAFCAQKGDGPISL
jgi:hypothetical protein